MHFIFASVLAIASLAAAQVSVTDIPQCALDCFLAGVGNSTCAVTDQVCQCTKQAAKIGSIVIPCLCASDCAPPDLKKANEVSYELCKAALTAAGISYEAPSLGDNICQTTTAPTTPSSTATSSSMPMESMSMSMSMPPPAYPTGSNATNMSSTTTSASPSGTQPANYTGAAPAVGATESFTMLISLGFLGLAGAAIMAL